MDSTQTPDNETCNGLPSRSEKHFASYEFVLEELSRRAQAKTLLLEEVLQRCERSQLRFWGINE